jgi:hypothetical protein
VWRGIAFFGAFLFAVVIVPLFVWAAFSAHEASCPDAEAFWDGDLPTASGPVGGVILGSSRMGMDIDIYALAKETGLVWQRVARHAIEQASIPRSYPRMLGSTDAEPGMKRLIVEVSPLMFDEVGCARPELPGIPLRLPWWSAARKMLGSDAELAPDVAMGWLPHRWLMTSGRRHDIVEHLKKPAHLLSMVGDLPGILHGFSPPARWGGEVPPDLTPERAWRRRQFLFGAPIEGFVPTVNAACVATLAQVVEAAHAERTLLVIPPLRKLMKDTLPADYLAAVRAMADDVASHASGRVTVLDATDRFADAEDPRFSDFDHLAEPGAAALTPAIAAALAR